MAQNRAMPRRSSKRKKPRDLNSLAALIVAEATANEKPQEGERPNTDTAADEGKNPAAVALGRLGGLKGGRARAKKLSKARLSAIARRAAKKRWSKVGKRDGSK